MALLTQAEVRKRAEDTTQRVRKSARAILESAAVEEEEFDVFLSHSSNESEDILLGVTGLLQDRGLKVYVDKYTDPQLSPDEVTRETADVLRHRMQHSRALLYVFSPHSQKSRWMPWELGYFDGRNGRVGLLPVVTSSVSVFKGEEYLSLYPHVDIAPIEGTKQQELWINASLGYYAQLARWVRGLEQIRKRS
jgi:hypothetical protein